MTPPTTPEPGRRTDETIADLPSAADPVPSGAAPLPAPPHHDSHDAQTLRAGAAGPVTPGAVPAPTPALGQFGRYVLEGEIGRGGMGVVYRALDRELHRPVAVKMLLGEGGGLPPEVLRRFLAEARAAARLRHPNIVEVHDVGEIEGRHYLTMELIDGRPFSQLLAGRVEQREIPLRRAVEVLARAARALAYAHLQGIVHRDVKPGNILVDAAGEPFLTDFGLAKDVQSDAGERITVSGAVLGTPAYMSPEQAEGEASRVDGRTDVWALGAILYEVLAGRPPFEGSGPLQILHQILNREPEPPTRVAARAGRRIHADLETICLKCLEKDPARRYPSAGEVAADLERYLSGEPIDARPVSGLVRVGRRLRRNWLPASLAFAALAALATAAGVRLSLARAEERVLRVLRRNAAYAVEGTLELRRAGRLEAMGVFERMVREAHDEATRELHDRSPEPAYFLGRFERARLDFAAARRAQQEALAVDPAFAPALYESAVLAAEAYQRGLDAARGRHRARMALARSSDRSPEVGDLAEVTAEPTPAELAAGDAPLRALEADLLDLLARLARVLDADSTWAEQPSPFLRVGPARRLCLAGMRAAYGGKPWEESEDLLRRALADDPQLEEAYVARYCAATAAGRWEDAARVAGEGIAADRGYAPHWCHRGQAAATLGNARALQGQDPEPGFAAALADYNQAIALDAAAADPYLLRGDARHLLAWYRENLGRDPEELLQSAIADYEAALVRDPGSIAGRLGRGQALGQWTAYLSHHARDTGDRIERAIADFSDAIRLDPASVDAWVRRGAARFDRAVIDSRAGRDAGRDFQDGEADLAQALRLAPASVLAWSIRGSLRADWATWRALHGQDPDATYAAADADLGEAVRLSPRYADAWRLRAEMRCQWATYRARRSQPAREIFESAVKDAQTAQSINPRSAQAWEACGRARLNFGGELERQGADAGPVWEAGLADLTHAAELNAGLAQIWFDRAALIGDLAHRDAGAGRDPTPRYREALDDLGKAIDLDRSDGLAWLNRGKVHFNLGTWTRDHGGDPEEWFAAALGDYDASIGVAPDFAEAWENRAAVRTQIGLWRQGHGGDGSELHRAAIADAARAIELDPADSGAWTTRGAAQANWGYGKLQSGEIDFDLFRAAVRDWTKSLALRADQPVARQWMINVEGMLQNLARWEHAPEWKRWCLKGDTFLQRRDYPSARAAYERSLALRGEAAPAPEDRTLVMNMHYCFACFASLRSVGRDGPDAPPQPVSPEYAARGRDEAFRALERALEFGWTDRAHLAEDADLEPLHGDGRWAELLARLGK